MTTQPTQNRRRTVPKPQGIANIAVAGFKSIKDRQSIEIRPLTILAGANSSGKSSIMQPLLLLKQTLEASYDPGALLLDGPNVKFTSADQLLSCINQTDQNSGFQVELRSTSNIVGILANANVILYFHKIPKKGFEIERMSVQVGNQERTLRPEMTNEDIIALLFSDSDALKEISHDKFKHVIVRNRCFLDISLRSTDPRFNKLIALPGLVFSEGPAEVLRGLLYLPGLRGNPERSYPMTAVGSTFPGPFQNYTASIIAHWQTEGNSKMLEGLSSDLRRLNLTWQVKANPLNDTQVELQVGRLHSRMQGEASELVNIADVGLGVSQVLPVLVALRVAKPGQLVYLEQPEIHLHPRAQSLLAQMLADAAKRGVRVVVETHSSLLILGIQTLVAEGKLASELVKLHWFDRQRDGSTRVRSADVNEIGAFGEWPEDFADVALQAESRYLDAAESKQRKNGRATPLHETTRH